jgi:hypothetical protein
MPSRVSFALLAALLAAGCAATTPPPRFSAVSPADPDGPEGALPPAAAVLTAASPGPGATPTPTPTPAHHHHGNQP